MTSLTIATPIPPFHAGSLARGCAAMRRDPVGTVAMVALVALAAISVFAPFIAPYDPDKQGPALLAAPSLQHLAGTDQFGRDVLSRVIYGGRESLAIGFGAAAIGGL